MTDTRRRRRPLRRAAVPALALICALAVTLAPSVSATVAHPVPAGGAFTFRGHGWGHGIGMSQWGAEGQALKGRTAKQILDFYYPHTTETSIGNPTLRVQLRYVGGGPTVVRWSQGLAVYDMTPGHGHAGVALPKCPPKADTCGGLWWAATYPTAHGPRMRLVYQTDAGTLHTKTYHFSGVVGPLRFGHGSATNGQAGTHVTLLPDHLSGNRARAYGGLIDATPVKGTCGKSACPMATVANVPMQEYLRGVVPYEAIDSWKPAALQAQAVAARTYAEQDRESASYDKQHLAGKKHPWDICDTTSCQVYAGNGRDGQFHSDDAVRATAGRIRSYGGHPISALYSASNGGWTVQDLYGAPAPYLPAKKDPYDAAGGANPWTNWSKTVPASVFAKHMPGHGALASLQITGRDGHGDWGGRVTSVELRFADGHTTTVSGGTIRSWAGLRSTWFTISASIQREGGHNRQQTAVAVSKATFAGKAAGAVVLTRQDRYPDALAGGPLAVAENAPLLLTRTDRLDPATADEIRRVLPTGGTVYLLGGTGALSGAIAQAVHGLGDNVQRLGGHDRYDTAVAIAKQLPAARTVFLATGTNFPDALVASAAAAHHDGVVLLTHGSRPAAATKRYLGEHPSAATYAIGGPAVAAAHADHEIAGSNRYATAVDVAAKLFDRPTAAGLATGQTFPDALTAAAQLGRSGAPISLTRRDRLPKTTADYLSSVGGRLTSVYVYGGSAAVSDPVVDAVQAAVG